MILYHGSNTVIDKVDLEKCRPYKDFGRGFYLTDIEPQAIRMAARTAKTFGGTPCVSAYEFDLATAEAAGLKIKVFDGPSTEWAQFVMANRDINSPQPFHDFDLVIGPVADDTITRLLRLYTENFISQDELLRQLTFSQVTSQYLFHTQQAVSLLTKYDR